MKVLDCSGVLRKFLEITTQTSPRLRVTWSPPCFLFLQGESWAICIYYVPYIYYVPTSWKLQPTGAFLLFKGKMVNRQELVNDNTNKNVLNQILKQHLTGFVLEYNSEVREQRGPRERAAVLVRRATRLPLSFQNKDLIYELQILSHMLLFASKSSPSFGRIMQHYRAAAKVFQNKVRGRRHPIMRPAPVGLPYGFAYAFVHRLPDLHLGAIYCLPFKFKPASSSLPAQCLPLSCQTYAPSLLLLSPLGSTVVRLRFGWTTLH